jgi:hypothetical protein
MLHCPHVILYYVICSDAFCVGCLKLIDTHTDDFTSHVAPDLVHTLNLHQIRVVSQTSILLTRFGT